MAKIWMQGKERFMCPVCKNEEIELGQKYCQICGEPLEWEAEASAEGLSLDEAIIHARETAEKKYLEGFLYYANSGNIENDKKNDEYIKCAEEHEQLAEWLEELKKYREVENQHRWIPVEERLPEPGEPVWATVKHSAWISDYDADWLPEAEKTYHPESYGVYKAEYIGEGIWQYSDDYCEWIYCDAVEKEERNLANVYDTVTAWMPLSAPYWKEDQR